MIHKTQLYMTRISLNQTSARQQKCLKIHAEIDASLEVDNRLKKFQSELPVALRWIQGKIFASLQGYVHES
jgi:hypothetical protein